MTGGVRNRVVQRDIVLIPFTYTDLSRTKVRPALVISDDEYNNGRLGDMIVCAITSSDNSSQYDVNIKTLDLDYGKKPLKYKS